MGELRSKRMTSLSWSIMRVPHINKALRTARDTA